MVFSETSFLFFFLPFALAVGLLLSRFAFTPAILAISLIFYYWTAGPYTLILLFSILFNYLGGLTLARCRTNWVLLPFVLVDLLLLAYYKYAGFLASNIDDVAGTHVAGVLGAIVLPIGISFFTFQGISYLVDVYRGDVPAEPNPIVFGAYKAFFPQLIAGPIVRYRDVAVDFRNPKIGVDMFAAGAARFAHGLLKKVLIADNVAPIVDATFGLAPGAVGFSGAWLGALAFAVQIYFDFSGYSDMAIGLGQMFGIRIPENFDHPYASGSITEFWRRWHISLSMWFRDYLYIPLGGNRRGTLATYRNLIFVFFLVGLWHGAAWTYVVWGLYNGAFLILERIAAPNRQALFTGTGSPTIGKLGLRLLYCAPVVLIGWVIFRAADLNRAFSTILAMFSPAGARAYTLDDIVLASLAPLPHRFGLVVGSLAFFLPGRFTFGRILSRLDLPAWAEAASLAYTVAACVIAGLLVLPGGFSPFLYFQF